MINLVPEWARHYDEFWKSIRGRNLWFIKLRYGAVIMLAALLISADLVLGIQFDALQFNAIIYITTGILLYNLILHYLRRHIKFDVNKFNPVHLSLLQIVLDFTSLMLLVHYTGGIESPLYMLFVFHMIIGSLILPGILINSVAIVIVGVFWFMVFGEYYGLLPHLSVKGLLGTSIYNDFNYVMSFAVIFAFVIFISVMLTNRIARQLYQLEQKLFESLAKLKIAEVEKQKYIIGVVHEIKTPLTAVHSYIELILQKILGPVNEKISDRLMRAKMRSDEAIQLTNNILKISKLRLLDETVKETVKAEEITKNILRKYDVMIRQKKIKLIYKDNRESKSSFQGDPVLIEIALSNLIGNAIKYVMHDGKVEIIITEAEGQLKIMISDSGIGIPEKDQQKIFTDFYRASNVKNESYDGSGLGLSIVKQVIERHGGTISVKSPSHLAEKDKPGTTFILILPVNE